MKRWLWLVLLFIPHCAFAQTRTTVTASIQDSSGNPATSGYVEFRLQPASTSLGYRVTGTTVVAPQTSRCTIAAGALSSCSVWGNTTLQPASSCYDVVIAPGNVVRTTTRQSISGTTYDLSTPTFCTTVNVVPQYQTITTAPINANLVPAATKVFNLGDSGHYYGQAYIDNAFVNNFNAITSLTVATLQSTNIANSNTITTTNLTVTGVFNGPAATVTFPTLTDNTIPVVTATTKVLRDSDIIEDDTGGPGLNLVKINSRLLVNGTQSDFNGIGSTVILGGIVEANSPTNAQIVRMYALGGGGGATFDSGHTGNAITKPFFWSFDNAVPQTMKLTTDGVFELMQSYAGANVSDAGTVAFRNNAGVLEVSQNGAAWATIGGGGGGTLTGSCATVGRVPQMATSTSITCSLLQNVSSNLSTVGAELIANSAAADVNPITANAGTGSATSNLVFKINGVSKGVIGTDAAGDIYMINAAGGNGKVVVANGTGNLFLDGGVGTQTNVELDANGTKAGTLLGINTGGGLLELITASGSFIQLTGNTQNIGLGSAQYAGGVGVISVGLATTAPASTPAFGGVLYVDPADNKLKYKGSSGTVTPLANP